LSILKILLILSNSRFSLKRSARSFDYAQGFQPSAVGGLPS